MGVILPLFVVKQTGVKIRFWEVTVTHKVAIKTVGTLAIVRTTPDYLCGVNSGSTNVAVAGLSGAGIIII